MLKLLLQITGLLLMLFGFLLQESRELPFVEDFIAGDFVKADTAFRELLKQSAQQSRNIGFFGQDLKGLPYIDSNVNGFNSLADLYANSCKYDAKGSIPLSGRVIRFYDALSFVPGKNGTANLIIAEWAHGVKTQTSYEEIRDLLDTQYDASAKPWRWGLFIVGFVIEIIAIGLNNTHTKSSVTLSSNNSNEVKT